MTSYPVPVYTSATTYLENILLNFVFRGSASPAGFTGGSVSFALYSGDPTDDDIPDMELSGSGYARIDVIKAYWTIASADASLWKQINFPSSTASWVDVTNAGVTSTSTGSLLYHSEIFQQPIAVDEGYTFSMPAAENYVIAGSMYSYYFGNLLFKNIFRAEHMDKLDLSVYLVLYTTVPNQSDVGGVEVSTSTGYTRVLIGGTGNWSVPTTGSITNQKTFTPIPYATSDVGTIRGIGIRTSPVAGTSYDKSILKWEFETPIDVYKGDILKFDSGSLVMYAD